MFIGKLSNLVSLNLDTILITYIKPAHYTHIKMSEINTLVLSDEYRAQIKEYIKQTTAYIDTLTKENEQMINDYEINKEQFDTIKKLSVNVSEEQKEKAC